MKKTAIKIRINSGHILVYSEDPMITESKCKDCGRVIYLAETTCGNKIIVSKHKDELVIHSMDCPALVRARIKKESKEYGKFKSKKKSSF